MRISVIVIVTLIVLTVACNPVNKVLKDPRKFETLAREVVRRGYCINDTITRDTVTQMVILDSLVHDTLQIPALINEAHLQIDTVFSSGARLIIDTNGKINLACPVKEIEHTSTINHYIRDLKREQLLQQDIDIRDGMINELNLNEQKLNQVITDKKKAILTLQSKIRTRNIQLVLVILLIIGYIGFRLYSGVRKILPI